MRAMLIIVLRFSLRYADAASMPMPFRALMRRFAELFRRLIFALPCFDFSPLARYHAADFAAS